MSRSNFAFSFLAVCIVGSLVVAERTADERSNWDPEESRATLFKSQDVNTNCATYANTEMDATVRRWTLSSAPGISTPNEGSTNQQPAAHISLLASSSAFLTMAKHFDSGWASTAGNGKMLSACSSTASNYDGNNCSALILKNNSLDSCSTTSGAAYCSAGMNGSPGGNGTNVDICSAVGANNGTNAAYCSTTTGEGTCSTQQSSTLGQCSTNSGTALNCSTGTLADSGGGAPGTCTALTNPNGAPNNPATNLCSVLQDGVAGAQNTCSTSGGENTACSAQTASDFCSVNLAAATNGTCTVIGSNPDPSATCSALIKAAANQCSTRNPTTGVITGPVNGVCGTVTPLSKTP